MAEDWRIKFVNKTVCERPYYTVAPVSWQRSATFHWNAHLAGSIRACSGDRLPNPTTVGYQLGPTGSSSSDVKPSKQSSHPWMTVPSLGSARGDERRSAASLAGIESAWAAAGREGAGTVLTQGTTNAPVIMQSRWNLPSAPVPPASRFSASQGAHPESGGGAGVILASGGTAAVSRAAGVSGILQLPASVPVTGNGRASQLRSGARGAPAVFGSDRELDAKISPAADSRGGPTGGNTSDNYDADYQQEMGKASSEWTKRDVDGSGRSTGSRGSFPSYMNQGHPVGVGQVHPRRRPAGPQGYTGRSSGAGSGSGSSEWTERHSTTKSESSGFDTPVEKSTATASSSDARSSHGS